MERDPNYTITWKDWAQVTIICIGVLVLIYLGVVITAEWGW